MMNQEEKSLLKVILGISTCVVFLLCLWLVSQTGGFYRLMTSILSCYIAVSMVVLIWLFSTSFQDLSNQTVFEKLETLGKSQIESIRSLGYNFSSSFNQNKQEWASFITKQQENLKNHQNSLVYELNKFLVGSLGLHKKEFDLKLHELSAMKREIELEQRQKYTQIEELYPKIEAEKVDYKKIGLKNNLNALIAEQTHLESKLHILSYHLRFLSTIEENNLLKNKQKQMRQLEDDLKEFKLNLEQEKAHVKTLTSTEGSLSEKVQELRGTLSTTASELTKVKRELTSAEGTINMLRVQETDCAKKLRESKENYDRELKMLKENYDKELQMLRIKITQARITLQ